METVFIKGLGLIGSSLARAIKQTHPQIQIIASDINEEMKLAAAYAIAGLVPDEELNENNIMPEAFDPKVAQVVANAVKSHIK